METLYQATITTLVGPLIAIASDDGLCGLEFEHANREALLGDRLRRWFPNHQLTKATHPILDETHSWLKYYFSGQFDLLKGLPLDLRGTEFERSVWELLSRIALGTTTTYGDLAAALRHANGARAVGLAVGRNPVCIIVPCHRVVGRNGALTGYGGGLERKRWLLGHEGVVTRGLFQVSAAGS
jgi:O-6-methylguanine DNA methyltransferase